MKIPGLNKIADISKKGSSKIGLPLAQGKPEEKGKMPESPQVVTKLPVDPITQLAEGMVSVQDVIAPGALEVDFDHLKIGNKYFRTLFVAGYPRFVAANWLAPLINFDHSLDVAMYVYPVEGKSILDELRRKIAEMEAEIQTDMQRGKIVDPATQAKLEDARTLQEQLVKGAERFFQFGLYITIPADSLEELNQASKEIESALGSLLIISKHATLQMEDGFRATIPTCVDRLMITRNMDTTSLATTFPFTSSELTANEGIMYGINEHNDSLVVFDRFTLENANSVIFAKSGAGKSYMVKLEALRSLLFGTEIIAIDPESEYKVLAEAVGGEYITFGFNSPSKINPFDLSAIYEEGENELGLKILSLHSLFKVIMGNLSATEEAVLDRALILTYKMKGITPDPATQKKEPPLMEDLYKALRGMEEPEASSLADRIEKFVKGSFSGIFDQRSNVDIKNKFTVFSIRDLEDALRPIAMFIILDYIWTKVKKEMKKRILIVDEAWYLMQYPDSANFLYSIAKRARKYYLGLTTITQDVEDFLVSEHGKAIIQNSSIQTLMKMSPAAIDKVAEIFYLSEGEKHLLLSADVGEGIFFAGPNHVAIRVVASKEEHQLITSKPEELLKIEEAKETESQESKTTDREEKTEITPL
ncbi:MAG TPA: ATP-binding protein [Patescibacteria group bacterium]|nr:ATP-binding protein [Patescibacteria group bacterium]